jgi:hypothetical protein
MKNLIIFGCLTIFTLFIGCVRTTPGEDISWKEAAEISKRQCDSMDQSVDKMTKLCAQAINLIEQRDSMLVELRDSLKTCQGK